MKKSILILIILFTLTGCSINPYKDGAIEYLDSLEPSIEYNPDDFEYWYADCFENCTDELIYEYTFVKQNDYFNELPPIAETDSDLLQNSSPIVNIYFANYITSEFYWDESYGNDLLSMFEYLDDTGKKYVFIPTYYGGGLSDEEVGIDYYNCPIEGVEYTSENTESKCYLNYNVTSLKPGEKYPTPDAYFDYIGDFNYKTFDYIEFMEFTGYYPTSIIEVYSTDYTEEEALQLEEDLQQFYNEDYMYINILVDDNTQYPNQTIYYYDSEGSKQESFDEYDPQYYKIS